MPVHEVPRQSFRAVTVVPELRSTMPMIDPSPRVIGPAIDRPCPEVTMDAIKPCVRSGRNHRRSAARRCLFPQRVAPGPRRLMMRPSLLRAYRKTDYRIACCVVRIGRRAPAIDRVLVSHRAREAALVTAYNPFSRRRPLGWNRRMQSRLAQAARRYTTLPAEGAWRGWSEDHLLLLANRRKVLCLAHRFRQHAIVSIRIGQPAYVLFTYQ